MNLQQHFRHLNKPNNQLSYSLTLTHHSFSHFNELYSVLVSVSCPKALYHLESDNLFRITVVVADWLG